MSADIVGAWKRTTSPQTHGRLIQANVSHYKAQLADKLQIEPGQPGSIHFAGADRGFDEEFFAQLLAEQKETKLFRGVRTTIWKRVRARNEGLDMLVMLLCHLDMLRVQIDRMSEPQTVKENGEKPLGQSVRPAWGVQPGSDQFVTPELKIGPSIQGYGVKERSGAEGKPKFGVQPSGPNFWDR